MEPRDLFFFVLILQYFILMFTAIKTFNTAKKTGLIDFSSYRSAIIITILVPVIGFIKSRFLQQNSKQKNNLI